MFATRHASTASATSRCARERVGATHLIFSLYLGPRVPTSILDDTARLTTRSRSHRPARGARRACARASTPRAVTASAGSTTIEFVKYQGLGNDFILVDNRDSAEVKLSSEASSRLCDRNFGIGGDGIIFAMPPSADGEDYSMRMFNSDGSEPEMCGNGIRCLARFVSDVDGSPPRAYKVGTLAGLIQPELRADGQVAVDMGEPILAPGDVPTTLEATRDGAVVRGELDVDGEKWSVTTVSMGNPHCVTFGRAGGEADGAGLSLDSFALSTYGPKFEAHPAFPAKTNTEFTQVINRNYVKMHVWERGAGATLACGTGACATVVAGVLEGRVDRNCVVELPGGPLEIEWRERDNRIIMTGPAERVFAGLVTA